MIQQVAVMAIEQMLLSSATMPLEMLEACRARLRLARSAEADFRVDILAQTTEPVVALGGFPLVANQTIGEAEETQSQYDLVVVPALWRNPRNIIDHHRPLIEWLRRQYQGGASIFAVGTGVCFLAEAGLLDGKPATTHWHYLDQFQRAYPKVSVQRQYLLTQAERIFCAASVNSGADMMVHLIGLLFGRELALQVEQQFSPEVRNPFEKKVFYADGRHQHGDESIALVQTWMQHNHREEICLADLAAMAGVGQRQFDRRFKQVVGVSPGFYLQQVRCDQARDLLQNTNLTVADIASSVGYQESGYFIRVFKKHAGQTPGQYRQKVRAKLFRA